MGGEFRSGSPLGLAGGCAGEGTNERVDGVGGGGKGSEGKGRRDADAGPPCLQPRCQCQHTLEES